VSFHAFRHTCASLLFANDKNIKQVQTWLGHADPAFTLRTYVHLMDDGVGAADFFDGAITEGASADPADPSEPGDDAWAIQRSVRRKKDTDGGAQGPS
jgi:hypothetical protein